MTLNTDLMFSSKTGKWDTPADLVDDLATVFDWDLDVCADGPNVCSNFYTEADDGLSKPWGNLNWCNPPYGRGDSGCLPWINTATLAWMWERKTTVFLIPARTDAAWWQDNIGDASQAVFIRGRLKFGSIDSWIKSYQTDILNRKKTPKQLNSLARKIGGLVCCESAQVKMAGMWRLIDSENPLSFTFDEWCHLDYVKPDSAPFPSAFTVFGEINSRQRGKLASYGWSINPATLL